MYIDENGGSDKRLVILMLLTVVQRAFLHFAFEMIQLPSSKIVSQKMTFVLVWFFIMRMVDRENKKETMDLAHFYHVINSVTF